MIITFIIITQYHIYFDMLDPWGNPILLVISNGVRNKIKTWVVGIPAFPSTKGLVETL